MFRYSKREKDEFVHDTPKSDVLVFDVDCQGLAHLNLSGNKLKTEFPKTYKKYMVSCIQKTALTGSAILHEEKGYKIALLYTSKGRVGTLRDDPELVLKNTRLCIDCLVQLLGEGAPVASGILNRHVSQAWGLLNVYINRVKLNWTVYKV